MERRALPACHSGVFLQRGRTVNLSGKTQVFQFDACEIELHQRVVDAAAIAVGHIVGLSRSGECISLSLRRECGLDLQFRSAGEHPGSLYGRDSLQGVAELGEVEGGIEGHCGVFAVGNKSHRFARHRSFVVGHREEGHAGICFPLQSLRTRIVVAAGAEREQRKGKGCKYMSFHRNSDGLAGAAGRV